jgi:hypothetical protein
MTTLRSRLAWPRCGQWRPSRQSFATLRVGSVAVLAMHRRLSLLWRRRPKLRGEASPQRVVASTRGIDSRTVHSRSEHHVNTTAPITWARTITERLINRLTPLRSESSRLVAGRHFAAPVVPKPGRTVATRVGVTRETRLAAHRPRLAAEPPTRRAMRPPAGRPVTLQRTLGVPADSRASLHSHFLHTREVTTLFEPQRTRSPLAPFYRDGSDHRMRRALEPEPKSVVHGPLGERRLRRLPMTGVAREPGDRTFARAAPAPLSWRSASTPVPESHAAGGKARSRSIESPVATNALLASAAHPTAPALRAESPASVVLGRAQIENLTEDVIRRIDKRARIERERRGH